MWEESSRVGFAARHDTGFRGKVHINGLKNGKGIDYDKNGNILFEGEYSKGERIIKIKNDNNDI